MTKLGTVDEILDFAIVSEQEASDFYTSLAGRVTSASMREVLLGFAKEEQGHKAKLLAVKAKKSLMGAEKAVLDLKLSDYVLDIEPTDNMDYAGALVLAMKKEKAAFRLYSDLAATTEDPGLKATLLGLAQEEAKHKLRFELEYDDHVLAEN
ncbi:MAG: ferritin family protein [Polyangia bacterium]|nr:ferritin family protein [Polyangia bacterium]